ncbi:MAG: mechanosensitive ion channel [Bacteroidia bacterium]|nr:mechanosensitive ion channel [Bacteroidia bacterium]
MKIHQQIHDWSYHFLLDAGVSHELAPYLNVLILAASALLSMWLLAIISRTVANFVFGQIAGKTRTQLDNYLLNNKVITYLSRLVPFLFIVNVLPVIFTRFPEYQGPVKHLTDIYLVLWMVWIFKAILNSIRDYLKTKDAYRDKPLDSFVQVLVILAWLVAAVVLFSILTGKSVTTFLTAMGAASAIILLIFKDTILGFVASIQVSANDMVRIGDWITMEKYGADGDVVEINLATVKVQNFDKTITTIPTYYLISDSFKNWRGMQQAGGRRIKRSVKIKVSSIRYLTEEDIEKFSRISLISEYLKTKGAELRAYNQMINGDTRLPINGRHFTNIGVYRKYIDAYIKANEHLHKGMTMMARQLEPSITGIPIELYVFTNDVRWENYEHIMADLFDHLLAAVSYFDLEVFEMPNSGDVRHLAGSVRPSDLGGGAVSGE